MSPYILALHEMIQYYHALGATEIEARLRKHLLECL